jgi:nucleotide-binding universal stress UspA family protein
MKLATAPAKLSLRHILFATDFSSTARTALHYARAFAKHFGSDVALLHVLPPAAYALTPPEAIGQTFDEMYQAADKELEAASHEFAGVPCAAFLQEGRVWEAVNTLAQDKETGLIVLGSHGRSGVGKLVLGSVAEEVFRRASCPVLVVGPRARAANGAEIKLRNLLFATDLESNSDVAIRYALALALEFQAHITLLHVIADKEHEHLPDHNRIVSYLFHRLFEKIPPDAELWCEPEIVVQCGEPAERILGVADERPADLIVLGLHATTHPQRAAHTPGTTIAQVIRQAECPVLTLHE